jgi:hypothetical protein
VLLDLVCAINIIIVGEIYDNDAGILHHILDVAKARNLGIWKDSVRIGPVGNNVHGGKSRLTEANLRIFLHYLSLHSPAGTSF